MSISFAAVFKALSIVLLANGAPLMATWWLGGRMAAPIDAGRNFPDGRSWLGPAKTWRGIVAGVALPVIASPLLGLTWKAAALAGAAAMAGDCFSSFLKRRLGVVTSGQTPGLDQVPESLFPAIVLGLPAAETFVVVAAFAIGGTILSLAAARFSVRRRPY